MAAILAKKLGMTQRFAEDGKVERVTVEWPSGASEEHKNLETRYAYQLTENKGLIKI